MSYPQPPQSPPPWAPPPRPPKPPLWQQPLFLIMSSSLALLVIFAIIGAISSAGQPATIRATTSRPAHTTTATSAAAAAPAPPQHDGAASQACTHFRNVMRDFGDGVLTGSELRGKLKEVNDDAGGSGTPGIAEGARTMLAAITTGTTSELATAIDSFSAACKAAGL